MHMATEWVKHAENIDNHENVDIHENMEEIKFFQFLSFNYYSYIYYPGCSFIGLFKRIYSFWESERKYATILPC